MSAVEKNIYSFELHTYELAKYVVLLYEEGARLIAVVPLRGGPYLSLEVVYEATEEITMEVKT